MGDGYKGHNEGSAKGKVHKVYDEKGQEAALKLAEKLGKADSTARTWCSEWKNEDASPKKKKVAKKAAPAKKAPAKKAAKKGKKKGGVKREKLGEDRASA